MRLFYFPLWLAVLLVQPLPCMAQAPQDVPLTLQQAIKQAQEFNPDLVAKLRDMDIAEAGLEQAKVLPNPELAALTEGLEKGKRTTTIQINQLIELGGKRSSRINAAKRDQQVVLADLAVRRGQLRADVIAAFFEVVNTQERIQLAQASYQLASKVTEVVKRRVTAGRISPIEATRTSVAELTIKNELAQAKTDLALAKIRLAALWGDVVPKFNVVANDGAVKSSDNSYDDLSALQSRLKNSPQLALAQLEINRQQAQLEVERSRRIGDVTLSVGKKRDEEVGRSQTVLGLSIPIPLFDRNQGNVLGALRKTDQARDALNAVEQRLSSELAQAWQRHASTKTELQMLREEILPQAENAIAATVTGFEFGKFNLLDVLEAQRTLFQTKLQYLQAQADSYRSMADMERIIGQDLFKTALTHEALP